MPSKPIDYTNTHFYKIVCKDTTITDCYVGHTTDFTKRKSHHKKTCNSQTDKHSSIYLYQFIRENGGWENWDMVEIERRCCENSLDARRIEREYIEQLKSESNIVKRPTITKVERNETVYKWRDKNREEINENRKSNYQDNINGVKDKQKEWYLLNKEKAKQQNKTNYDNKKEAIIERNNKWKEENKDTYKHIMSEYYLTNIEKIKAYRKDNYPKVKERRSEVIECPCGIKHTYGVRARHFKSKTHQAYLNQQHEN